jgi:acyl-CoA thioester hydrolase
MESINTQLRVRYSETDQMGIVYHANYLVWMEVGRVEYCRAKGARYRDLETQAGILLAVVEVNCRYLSPARYDEEVIVRTHIEHANPRMVRFRYELISAEGGHCLASGFTKHIFCGRDFRATKLPEKYRPLFGIGSDSAE